MEKVGAYTDRATEVGEWRSGNPSTGQQATPMLAAYFNMLQRELVSVVEAAGLDLDATDDTQLLEAITLIIEGKVPDSVIVALSASTVLSPQQMGLVLADASGGARAFTLPPANEALGIVDVVVRRIDNSGNRLVVQASGTDRIKFHTHLRAEGYGFLYLMGAGDWWHLRSDRAGNWWPIGRYDSDALGRPVFATTTMVAPGGWGVFAGTSFVRAEWPWLWDHAQASGMLTTEAARAGMEGGWTSGDGALTFRGPEGRGEFPRVLDDGRGVDAGRVAGSSQLDAMQGHRHAALHNNFVNNAALNTAPGSSYAGGANTNATTGNPVTDTVNGAPRVAAETRGRNIAYPGRIKLI